jgi:predicted amidohydrolase
MSKEEFLAVSEFVPDGDSTKRLIEIARETGMYVLAGLFEKDASNHIYKTYICVGPEGFVTKFRKLHPFINAHITPGDAYLKFDLLGWCCSILICYDNNIPENVRATALLGAEIIFMPHVTMCTPSPAPGRGFVDPRLWQNRQRDPTSLRLEFEGPKGRAWLMKWLPSRAYDNGIYAVFSNSVGMDDDRVKNGYSMILDPFGDILNECRSFDDCFVIATCTKEKIRQSGGYRYALARRPELYAEIIGKPHQSVQKVAWMQDEPVKDPKEKFTR